MRADGPDAAAPVVASQHIALTALRSVFDRMDADLVAAVDRERRVADGLERATTEADALRARLLALGAAVRELRSEEAVLAAAEARRPRVLIGREARLVDLLVTLSPVLAATLAAKVDTTGRRRQDKVERPRR